MFDFLQNINDDLLLIFWYIAIVAGSIFVVTFALTIMGADSDIDTDFDVDMDFQFITFKNFVNFFVGVGFGGIIFYESFENKSYVVGTSLICGIIMVVMYFVILKQMSKLNQDNTIKYSDLIGQTATVYLTIPGDDQDGKGLIHVSHNGSIHEISAISEDEKSIPTSSMVRITDMVLSTAVVEIVSKNSSISAKLASV